MTLLLNVLSDLFVVEDLKAGGVELGAADTVVLVVVAIEENAVGLAVAALEVEASLFGFKVKFELGSCTC